MRRRTWIIVGPVIAAMTLAACSGSSTVDAGGTTVADGTPTTISEGQGSPGRNVSIENFSFGPGDVVVGVGETVTWTNDSGGTAHTTTSDDGIWDSGSLSADTAFTHTFNEAGGFTYFCSIHPSMTATVTVEG
jgi:plastocyanin